MRRVVSALADLAARVGVAPTSEILITAMTHSSYAAEHGTTSNERLEFLGDAVVDLVIADLIFRRYPELNEGGASLARSHVVNESSLADAARALGLDQMMRVGRGVVKERGLERPSLLADAFEALIAALYLERGYEAARDFVDECLRDALSVAVKEPGAVDPKTQLRQWSESSGRGAPDYEVNVEGPSHRAVYRARVVVNGDVLAEGTGHSKKSAEADAARRAWEDLNA